MNDQASMNKTSPSPDFLGIPGRTDDGGSLSSDALSDVPSEAIIKERIHHGGRWSACKGLLMEYSKSSSIHGIRYLFEVHRPIYEKIFWLVTLSTSLYLGFSLSRDIYRKWQDSPVILTFGDTLVPVHEIPFPTITICSHTKITRYGSLFPLFARTLVKESYNETDDYEYYDYGNESYTFFESFREELSQMAASLHICENEFSLKYPHLLKEFEDPQKTGNILYDISLFFLFDNFLYTHFNGDKYFINQMFQDVATDEGICLQFNGMAQEDIFRNDSIPSAITNSLRYDKDNEERNAFRFNRVTGNWSLEDGYIGQGFHAYPKRTVFASIHKGLEAALSTFSHEGNSYCPGDDKIGYKIYLNSPESIPQTSGNYIQISPDQEVIISLLPQYVKATPDLRNYEPRKRQCYFNDERYLRLFRQYSQSNCQTECLVNFTIAQCGCVQFWMPKPAGVSACGVMDIGCYRNAQTKFNLILQNQTLRAQRDRSAEIMCDCMPACTTLEYNFEISRARYDTSKLNKAMREHYGDNTTNFKVFFKERQFMAIKRTVLFSMTTLLANFGSICGLLMGISGLSLIELVYFVSLRLYNNVQRRRIAKKKLQRKAQRKLKK